MDQWLVRSANNIIAGPYSKDQVIQLIREGKLGVQDEVCRANHYWIYLHEHQEVQNQLGIQIPRSGRGKGSHGEDEEITETQVELTTDEATEQPHVSAFDASDGMTTAVRAQVTSPDSASRLPQANRSRLSGPPHATMAAGHLERPSIWRGFAWLMIVVACLLVAAVLRLLRQTQG